MIRHFEKIDLRRIELNKYSDISGLDFVFEDEDFYKFSLIGEKSEVYAIICFKKYWKNNVVAFFLISKNMNSIYGRELKNFIYKAKEDLNVERIQTDSVDCEELNRWHRFLGLELEGTRKKMLYGKDYNCWGLL